VSERSSANKNAAHLAGRYVKVGWDVTVRGRVGGTLEIGVGSDVMQTWVFGSCEC
jgi:hypothetical protein